MGVNEEQRRYKGIIGPYNDGKKISLSLGSLTNREEKQSIMGIDSLF